VGGLIIHRHLHAPIPALYSSDSRSWISSSFISFVLFGRPLRRADRSSSRSWSCLVNQTSRIKECSSSSDSTPCGGKAWKKNPYTSTRCQFRVILRADWKCAHLVRRTFSCAEMLLPTACSFGSGCVHLGPLFVSQDERFSPSFAFAVTWTAPW